MRFTYDNEKFKLSNIKTNEITNNVKEYFEFEDEFKNSLDVFTISNQDSIKMIYSFNPPVELKEDGHIIEKEGIGKVVNTDGGVLLGKISFQMTEDIFDISSFKLVEDFESSPLTGVKINCDGLHYFDNQSTFRFADNTLSKDAYLANIIISSEEKGENLADKEYALSPEFNKETKEYELKLLEYVDNLNIKAIQSDVNANMKIIVPKRDKEDNLVYDSDETEIIYEEKEIKNGIPLEIKLNKIGEQDTIIKIIVIAENKIATEEYTIVIKRPYGTIRGSIHTINSEDKHIADIKLYETKEKIDWENLYGHDQLDLISTMISEKSDEAGIYEIKVIPGQYDLMIDKPAYLDYIVTEIMVKENDEIDLGNVELIPGDINKDGIVDTEDLTFVNIYYDVMQKDAEYELKYDITEDGIIESEDITYINIYYDKKRTINKY